MSLPTFNTKSPTIKRILKEASELSTNPDPSLHASPLESNLFEWHFTLAGPPHTPYSQGIYHGRIILPPSYPLRPPSFRFLTPSGRFEVNREICLSISGHHEETWQPAWGIRTALWALRAFMEGGARGQVGGMEMGDGERRRLASESRAWRCMGCGGKENQEILKGEEERCRSEGGRRQAGEEVPKELKLEFRDEMRDAGKTETDTSGLIRSEESPIIPTVSPTTSSSNASSRMLPIASTATVSPQTAAPPISSVASTTHVASAAPPAFAPVSAPPPPIGRSDPVPAWIDKAIAGLVAGLAFMVIKKVMV
ncbi:hypothetical protein MMC07_004378 [Pseudocyphellaria aurata]|nr:hypothetical protein [Pseudocyphellaria aurata]